MLYKYVTNKTLKTMSALIDHLTIVLIFGAIFGVVLTAYVAGAEAIIKRFPKVRNYVENFFADND